jgi:hypothetical protein
MVENDHVVQSRVTVLIGKILRSELRFLVVSFSSSTQMLRYYSDYASTASFHTLSSFSFINHRIIRRYIV